MNKVKKYIIIGAGGLGREIFSYLTSDKIQPFCFLDDNPSALDSYNYKVPILNLKEYEPQENHILLLAIANPYIKESVYKTLKQKNASFLTYVHSTAFIGHNVNIKDACIIAPYSIVTADIKIGTGVFINTNTTIGHDVEIGNFSTINGKVEICGHNKIGKNCILGVGSIIIPNRKIYDDATIGAGSIIIRKVEKGTTFFGNPGKCIKKQRG